MMWGTHAHKRRLSNRTPDVAMPAPDCSSVCPPTHDIYSKTHYTQQGFFVSRDSEQNAFLKAQEVFKKHILIKLCFLIHGVGILVY